MSGVEKRKGRRLVALRLAVAGALAWGSLAAGAAAPAQAAQLGYPAPVQGRGPNAVSANTLPTAQIDSGVVWALKISGNTVYAGGSFSNARPAGAASGQNLVPRTNLLSFNLTTGALSSFAPSLNGQVKALALSPDGTRLYAGGAFTQVNGKTRWLIAAFNTATGDLLETFKPSVGGSYINSIVATNSAVYVGGLIGAGNGVARKNLVAFDTSGNLLGWAPTTDLQVDTMVMNTSGSKLIVGGRFATVNDVSQRGLAALSPSDGSLLPWDVTNTVKNGSNTSPYIGKAGIYALSNDGNAVYGTGWVYANATIGNLEGSFSADPETGAIKWIEDCHGDTYGAYSDGGTVYAIGHVHDCESVGGYPQKSGNPGNMKNSLAFTAETKGTLWRSPRVSSIYADWQGYPAPAMVNWFPDWTTGTASGSGQAGWVIDGSGDYVVVGGEFPFVNGQWSQGIARFARPGTAAATLGPILKGADWVPSVASVSTGTARVTIPANYDREDIDLTYRITRNGQQVYSGTTRAFYWYQPAVTFLDTGLTPGNTYTYQVTAVDSDGNQAQSSSVSVTASGTAQSAYFNRVLADGATPYWQLGTSGDSTYAYDALGISNGLKGTGVTVAGTGAIGSGVGSTFSGTSSGRIGAAQKLVSPDDFSAEIWFRTTTNRGGKLFGWGSSQTSTSSSYDRHLYMLNDGRLSFGVFQNNTAKVVTTSATYRNGAWHHAVVTSGWAGTTIYVDGVQAAFDANVMKGQEFDGYWRVGGDNLSGWPNRPSSDYFSGDLDEFAAYPTMLTPSQVQSHYQLATGAVAPTASFTNTVSDLHVTLDGSASTAQSGQTITGYSWDFGDGTPAATGATAVHDYAAGGTYTVTLTVTDSRGLTGQATKQVTVAPAHQPPTASFTVSDSGLTASVDASASEAFDGATLTYDWDWGDGTSHGSGKTASHAYASAGDKTIVLTLTDSMGATSTTNKTVTLTHANPKASFTASTDGFTTSVDAGASTASDGATLSYDWNWGDGSGHGSGATATHTYDAAGDYTVTLTVTDSLGGSDTATKTVTAVDPSSLVVADAGFGTDVASGWGSASKGGSWTTSGSGFSVSGGVGRISLAASSTRTASLNAVSEQNVVGAVQVGLDKVPVGGRADVNYDLRKSSNGSYRVKVRFLADASVSVLLTKVVGTTETVITTRTLTGYTFAAGDKLDITFEVNGNGTSTTARAKVWGPGQSEPSSWTVSGTDATAALQGSGAVGLVGYVQSAVTNGPIVVLVDNLKVTRLA